MWTIFGRGHVMVGRTRLYRKTGSPLISGFTSARRRVWPWVVVAVLVLAAGAWVYLTYVR
jgi:hypothetical protein